MTANQIAFSSVAANKEIAANQLAETERHNAEMEEIEKSKLDYQNKALQVSIDWNDWQKSWAEEYTAKWRQLEYAQEEERIDIQRDLANLESNKFQKDAWYKEQVAYNQSVANELQRDQNRITEDWNKMRNSTEWASLGLTEKDLFLKEKQIEYENSWRHEQNVIAHNFNVAQMDYKWASLNFEREQMNRSLSNQYGIALLQANTRMSELALQEKQYNLSSEKFYKMELPNSRYQNFNYLSSGLTGRQGFIPVTLDVVKTFTPLGATNVTTKAIARQLFKD